ncbi:MAG: DUF1273 domain-containing protein [Ruminococcaceae bacterium]|nr:DUF1273 domain-containing protein [Oscillospiraceae bacterium]
MKEQTCCFTGHRLIAKSEIPIVRKRLRNTVIELINKGVIYYGAGGALGFDTIAAQTILDLKAEYPQIKLILVLPCINQTAKWKQSDVDMYEYIKSKCDKYVYTSKEYYDECMKKRNRHLVDNSAYCICYLTHNRGGTYYTYNYAKENGLQIFNVAEGKE